MALTCPNCSTRFKVKPEALGSQGRSVKCAKCAHKWFATADDLEPDKGGVKSAPAKSAPNKSAPKAAPKAAPAPKPAPEPPPGPDPDPFDDDFDASDPDSDPDAIDASEDVAPAAPPSRSEPPGFDAPPFGDDEEIVPRQRTPKPQKKSPLGAWIFLGVLVLAVAVGGFFFRFDIVKAYRPANAVFAAIGFPVDTLGFGLTIDQPQTRAIIKQDERVLEVTGTITNTSADAIEVPLLRGALLNAQDMEVHVWSFSTGEPRVLPGETVTYTTNVTNPPRGATDLLVTFTRPEELEAEMGRDGGDDGGMAEPEQQPTQDGG